MVQKRLWAIPLTSGPGYTLQLLISSPLIEVGAPFRDFHFYPYRTFLNRD
jgi:hypothetical protein